MTSRNFLHYASTLYQQDQKNFLFGAECKNKQAQFDKAHPALSNPNWTPDFSSIVLDLMELRDLEQNIYWIKKSKEEIKAKFPDELATRGMIIRDAKESIDPPKVDIYAFQIQAINTLRGALDLSDNIKYQDLQAYLQTFFEESKRAKTKKELKRAYQNFCDHLVAKVAVTLNIKIDQAVERLSMAREFANLHIEPVDIVTVTQLENAHQEKFSFFQGDSPIISEWTKQDEEYQKESWFKDIKLDWQKDLVKKHLANLRKGRIIPTQLRNILPGIRNAYEHCNGVMGEDNKFKPLHDNYHAGTIAFFGKEEESIFRVEEANADQLKEMHIGGIVTLVSPLPFFYDDQKIVNDSQAVTEVKGMSFSNIPFNAGRFVLSVETDGLEALLNEVVITFNQHQEVKEFLKGSNEVSPQLLKDKLKTSQLDEQTKSILVTAIHLRALLNEKEAKFIDAADLNLLIATYAIILDSHLARFSPATHQRLLFTCQSGKDRTGLLIFNIDAMEGMHVIGGDYSDSDLNLNELFQTIAKKLARGGHIQFLSGYLGGTLGAFGIKPDTRSSIPATLDKVEDILVLDTAKNNKKIPITPQATVIYEDLKVKSLAFEQLYKKLNADLNIDSDRGEVVKREQLQQQIEKYGGFTPYIKRLYRKDKINIADFISLSCCHYNQSPSSSTEKFEHVNRKINIILKDLGWEKMGRKGFFAAKVPDGISVLKNKITWEAKVQFLAEKLSKPKSYFYKMTGVRCQVTQDFYDLILAINQLDKKNPAALSAMLDAIAAFEDSYSHIFNPHPSTNLVKENKLNA